MDYVKKIECMPLRQVVQTANLQMNAWYLFIESYSPDRAALVQALAGAVMLWSWAKLFIFTVPLPTLV